MKRKYHLNKTCLLIAFGMIVAGQVVVILIPDHGITSPSLIYQYAMLKILASGATLTGSLLLLFELAVASRRKQPVTSVCNTCGAGFYLVTDLYCRKCGSKR